MKYWFALRSTQMCLPRFIRIWAGFGTQQISIYGLCFRRVNQSSSDSQCIPSAFISMYLCIICVSHSKPFKRKKKTQTQISYQWGWFCADHFAQLQAHLHCIIILKTNFQSKCNQDQLQAQFSFLCATPRECGAVSVPACALAEQTRQAADKGVSSSCTFQAGNVLTDPSPAWERLVGKPQLVHLG